MKFLLDQDVFTSTARYLNDLRHDIVSVAPLGLSQTGKMSKLCIT